MRINSVNNIQFGKVRFKRTPINFSYAKAIVESDQKILSCLDDSLAKIGAKTGSKTYDFRVDLVKSKNPEDKQMYWNLCVVDPVNANPISEVEINRNASVEEYLKQIKLLAINTPKIEQITTARDLFGKYQ